MSTSTNTRLTPARIQQHVACVADSIERMGAPSADVTGLDEFADVGGRLDILRAQYRADPASMAEHVNKLAELSRRFDALLAARMPEVIDRFHAANEELRRVKNEKEFWREFLIRQAPAGPRETLRGATVDVVIKSSESRALPASGSESRLRLESVIQESGFWSDVSQLSKPKLQHALKENLFGGSQRQLIEELCPAMVTHTVTSHVRGA